MVGNTFFSLAGFDDGLMYAIFHHHSLLTSFTGARQRNTSIYLYAVEDGVFRKSRCLRRYLRPCTLQQHKHRRPINSFSRSIDIKNNNSKWQHKWQHSNNRPWVDSECILMGSPSISLPLPPPFEFE